MGKITYNRGTTANFGHIYQINGVEATTGETLLFTVKQSADDDVTDSEAVVKKNITMSGAENIITINPADVADTWDNGKYIYDIKVIDSVLGVQLLDSGQFTLTVTATNRYTS